MKTNYWRSQIQHGDALTLVQGMPDQVVHTIITSPPYWGLRQYKGKPMAWPAVSFAPVVGLPKIEVSAQTCALGEEPDLWAYVGHLVLVFRELRRVLRKDGTLWVVIGDSYISSPKGSIRTENSTLSGSKDYEARGTPPGLDKRKLTGLKSKNLCGIPWRVAFALQADGWYLRLDVIWNKSNAMPESVRDRPTKSHEYVFMFSRDKKYFYDKEAIKETAKGTGGGPFSENYAAAQPAHGGESSYRSKRDSFKRNGSKREQAIVPGTNYGTHRHDRKECEWDVETRNLRSVWTVPTVGYAGPHFAAYPPELIEPCLLASTSAKGVCLECGAQWRRVGKVESHKVEGGADVQKLGWGPTCRCGCPDVIPAVVLDPFLGTGTTAEVAIKNRRDWIGFELSEEYIQLAWQRLSALQVKLF